MNDVWFIPILIAIIAASSGWITASATAHARKREKDREDEANERASIADDWQRLRDSRQAALDDRDHLHRQLRETEQYLSVCIVQLHTHGVDVPPRTHSSRNSKGTK